MSKGFLRSASALLSLAVAGALLMGCQAKPKGQETGSPVAASSPCQEPGQRLTATGLCPHEAKALMISDPEVRTPELENCTWAIKDLSLPGDEALLYRAATCAGVETELSFAGGAHRAEIAYERSAVYGEAAKGRVIIALYGTDPDPQGALKQAIAEAPKEKTGPCQILKAEIEGWPKDALVLSPSAEARAKLPPQTRLKACGPSGIDETGQSYWRVRQGYAWYFNLGPKDPDIDAGNAVIIHKGADGHWQVKP